MVSDKTSVSRDHLRQELFAPRRRTAGFERRREIFEHAAFKRRHHGVMHIGTAAHRRRIGQLFGGKAHRFAHLLAPPRRARGGNGARQVLEHRCRRAQRRAADRARSARDTAGPASLQYRPDPDTTATASTSVANAESIASRSALSPKKTPPL